MCIGVGRARRSGCRSTAPGVCDQSEKIEAKGKRRNGALLFFGRFGWVRDAGLSVTAAVSIFACPGVWNPRALPVAATPNLR